jgi:hypothetical protein
MFRPTGQAQLLVDRSPTPEPASVFWAAVATRLAGDGSRG